MYATTSLEQFIRQHRRPPAWFGVVDRVTQQLVRRCRTAAAAERAARRHNLASTHETAWCLEGVIMLGYCFLR